MNIEDLKKVFLTKNEFRQEMNLFRQEMFDKFESFRSDITKEIRELHTMIK